MRICSSHRDYEVPLVWTFSWAYNEYWCPYCGGHWDMFGSGVSSEENKLLKKRLESFKKATADYRNARGTLICEKTKWKGEYIHPTNLPKEEIERLKRIADAGWKLNIKIEDLNG